MSVGIPSTAACVIPHEFHGMSTEVTVAASSVVLLSNFGWNPCFLYACLYISAVSIIEMNWSPVTTFRNTPDVAVAPTSDVLDLGIEGEAEDLQEKKATLNPVNIDEVMNGVNK